MKRAALYIRVSTEEQAMHGYSLNAQRDNLTSYAKEHNMLIVDYYVDEGASARKKYTTRKEFMRMLNDIQAGLIDINSIHQDGPMVSECGRLLQGSGNS